MRGRRPTALFRTGFEESVPTRVQCGFPGKVSTTAARATPSDSAVLWLPNACTTCMRHPPSKRGTPIRRHGLDPRRRKLSTRPAPAEGGVVAAFDGGSMTSDTGLLLGRLDQRLSLFGLARATDPPGQVTRPVVHQDTPAVEQVEAAYARSDAKLGSLRLHDLRHIAASQAAMSGENFALVGKLLGHQRHRTTAGYALLADAHLVRTAEKVGEISADAMRGNFAPAHMVRSGFTAYSNPNRPPRALSETRHCRHSGIDMFPFR